jgi:D-alanyl-D-alanine carboxypeptidase
MMTATLLSLLVILSPDLTLAPLSAIEPLGGLGVRPVDELRPARRPGPIRPLDAGSGTVRAVTSAAQPATASVAALPEADLGRWDAALDAARAYAGAYGITFAMARDGQLVWSGATGRHRDGRTELLGDDALVIGSLTKTFVSATVLQLVDEGRIGLDDRVSAHLGSVRTLAPEITIRQLLNHTSGLADVFNDATKVGIERFPGRYWDATELFATLHAPWYEPGDGYAYANTNYYLLGLLIERITGSTLADELERRFTGPLGLASTRILTGQHDGDLEPAWATIFWASGAMAASAGDLARWGDALYGDGTLSAETRAEMLKLNGERFGDPGENYGLGVQRIEVPGAVGQGHTGMLKTYTSLLLHLPEQDVTLALLVNRTHVDLAGTLAAKPLNGPSLLELAGVELPKPKPSPSPQP